MTTGPRGAPPEEGERARRVVGIVALAAVGEAVGGAVLATVAPEDAALFLVGMLLMGGAILSGVYCLWHGFAHHHERGRAAALVAVVVGVAVVSFLLWDRMSVFGSRR